MRGRRIEPSRAIDLGKGLHLPAFPFDHERVALDGIDVEVAFDGERGHPLAPALKIAANDRQKYIPDHKRAFPAVVIALSLASKKDRLDGMIADNRRKDVAINQFGATPSRRICIQSYLILDFEREIVKRGYKPPEGYIMRAKS
jgi:hypothetical protein